jgi:hypothetical protein
LDSSNFYVVEFLVIGALWEKKLAKKFGDQKLKSLGAISILGFISH